MLTPNLWVDVHVDSVEDVDARFSTVGEMAGLSVQQVLNLVATDPNWFSLSEDQETNRETLFIVEHAFINAIDTEVIRIVEDSDSILNEFSVVFNESRDAPGFIVTLAGLLVLNELSDGFTVFRRDPSGRYPDEPVRGLDRLVPLDDDMVRVDYEAPLNVPLEYHLRLHTNGAHFDIGPVLPTPLPFIPTLSDAYAGGTAFLKPIDLPESGRAIAIEELDTWQRPGNVLGEYHVLGRRNKVVITDVQGGREGTLRGHTILSMGQRLEDITEMFDPGVTLLLQNHNTTRSGFRDLYFKVRNASFDRRTKMSWYGELDTPVDEEVIITWSVDYVEVDRPDTAGVEVFVATWGVVEDTFATWDEVANLRDSWGHLERNPIGPMDLESS
jgi:hypothetical protein